MKKYRLIVSLVLLVSFLVVKPVLASQISPSPKPANAQLIATCDDTSNYIGVWDIGTDAFSFRPDFGNTGAVINIPGAIYWDTCADASTTGFSLPLGTYTFNEFSNDADFIASKVFPTDDIFAHGSTFDVVIPGCTDIRAANYDPNATFNDGSCEFDVSALINEIAFAQNLLDNSMEGTNHGEYLAGSQSIFQLAIDAANIVLNDLNSTQVDINAAVVSLTQAVLEYRVNQVPTPDTTDLENLIVSAQSYHDTGVEGIHHGEYSHGARSILQSAIDAAILVRDSITNVQSDVDQAAQNLWQARADFINQQVPTPDTTALAAAITAAQALVDNAQTGDQIGQFPTSVDLDDLKVVLQTAIDQATAVKNNTVNTQTEVDDAVRVLGLAMDTFNAPANVTAPLPPLVSVSSSSGFGGGASGIFPILARTGTVLGTNTDVHPVNSLILKGKIVYLVKENQILPFATEAEFYSYGYKFSNVVLATPADLELPVGPIMWAADGTLALDSGTVYLLQAGQKRPFASMNDIRALGYDLKKVWKMNLDRYTLGKIVGK